MEERFQRGNSIIYWQDAAHCGGRKHAFRDAVTNEDKYQALDNLKQFLHHYGNALVSKETADGLEVRWAHKVSVGAVYVGVGDVQRLRRETETVLSSNRRETSFLLLALQLQDSRKILLVTFDP